MLNKIDNISPGGEYSKANRPSAFSGNLASAYVRQSYIHDSVNISPALQFLNLIHWRLKEFKNIAKEKIYIDFILSDIEFQITLDLIGIEQADRLFYHIIKEGNDNYFSGKAFADVSVRIENIQYDSEPGVTNLSSLNVFFQRVFGHRMYNEITPADRFIMDEITNGIYSGIREEFGYINNQLFIFLDKLEGIRSDKRSRIDSEANEIITFKSIKLLNA